MSHKVTSQLINPQSIVVVGGSNTISKPGGKVLKNIIDGTFRGKLYVVNPKEEEVQGVKAYANVEEIPDCDLAILAIPARFCVETVKVLIEKKACKAFIIVSAGFSEENEEGAKLETELAKLVDDAGASLIGPNCIGVMTPYYQGVFTLPIPKLSPTGVDFISGSGATAVFIMESGIPKGLEFASVFSVGNSAQLGVEEILEYLDETYDPNTSSKNKILYIESIAKPEKLLKHATSLINKGCRIAAIKSGITEAGSRAASSHTGAMANPDVAVDALFRKAGIIRCYGREELSYLAGVFSHPEIEGNNIAIITHAGGPAVMLTDVLSEGGFKVPHLSGEGADELLTKLFPGSSVANPIDILATGTAEQVGECIDFCRNKINNIDAIVIIFGTAGLTEVFDVYDLIHQKMTEGGTPIFPVFPSIGTAELEVKSFIKKGHFNFPDEVLLGRALASVKNSPKPFNSGLFSEGMDVSLMRKVMDTAKPGYITGSEIYQLLDAAGIPRVQAFVAKTEGELLKEAAKCGFPLVMKVVGPLHKSDVGGVVLNIDSNDMLLEEFHKMKNIPGYEEVLLQRMVSGIELFLGASYEEGFGHIILCGLGGIFVEVIKDVNSGLVSVGKEEALTMIRSLKSYKIIQGIRGQKGVDEMKFAEIVMRLSSLLHYCPEIKEIDMNPLIAKENIITAVDARIRIS
ncbi:MAG: acetate--CoA ligase family protein [Bacteroidales bacterium]|nr:acetate--CoA ligase family protein [Bacteroidales bacterium]MCF8390214.1 acetate--CoA ligase family protein [Bacteroidales bacterium]